MRPLPKLVVDKSVATKPWKELRIEDFEIVGYFPHPMIRAEMAV
jgi:thymidylate synthase